LSHQQVVAVSDGMLFAEANSAFFAETSSKENTGIKELFVKIAHKLLEEHLKVRFITFIYGINAGQ